MRKSYKVRPDLFGSMAAFYDWLGRHRPGKVRVRVRLQGMHRRFMVRLGSSDLRTLSSVFKRKQYSLPLRRKPEVIVDAGANIGLSAIYFARRFPSARIFAIEPAPANFKLLVRNVRAYPNITPIRAALWKADTSIRVSPDPANGRGYDAYHALRRGDAEGMTVPARTLSSLMDEYGLSRIDLLKVDIEGSEREMFQNPSAWIGHVETIVLEEHERRFPGCGSSFFRAVSEFGYVGRRGNILVATRNPDFFSHPPRGYRRVSRDRAKRRPESVERGG